MDNMSTLDASIELEELICQLNVWLDDGWVGDAPWTVIEELIAQRPMDNEHPIVKQLLNCLSDPKRSASDFISVVGLLQKNFDEDLGCRLYLPYLGKVMIEALSIQNPVLDSSWEHTALIVLNFYDKYGLDENELSPDHLSVWIIQLMGNPNICLKLRIKLLSLLFKLYIINDHNWEMALLSVMSACSHLNTNNDNDCFLIMSPSVITKIIKVFTKNRYLLQFDQSLSEKLQNAKNSQISALLHDISYSLRMNSNRYIEPMEVQGIIALLNTTGKYAQLEYKAFQDEQIFLLKADHIEQLDEISDTLHILINNFIKSCQMPQLISVTASCIMDVVELILQVYASSPSYHDHLYTHILFKCELTLRIIVKSAFGLHHLNYSPDQQNMATSPIGREIISKFSRRLRGIRTKLEKLESLDCNLSSIYSLVLFD